MKKLFFLLSASLLTLCAAQAQTPSAERLMKQADEFYAAGRFAESNITIDSLLDNYPEISKKELSAYLNKKLDNCRALNDYAGASRTLHGLIQLYPNEPSMLAFDRWMQRMSDWPATTVERPQGNDTIPVEIHKMGRGEHLRVDVQMNGLTEPFIFDTGCANQNFVSETMAKRLGIRILTDSIGMAGQGRGYTKAGVADSLRIGDIVVRHPTFIITPDDDPSAQNGVEAVLGNAIIRALGELRIEADKGRIVLPAKPSEAPQEQNLTFDHGQYYLSTADGQVFHFDTGNVKTTLSSVYFDKNRRSVRHEGKKSTSTSGGFGGIATKKVYVLPQFTFDVPQRDVTLHDVTVDLQKVMAVETDYELGNIGVDFLRSCDAVTIDLQRMFVRTE